MSSELYVAGCPARNSLSVPDQAKTVTACCPEALSYLDFSLNEMATAMVCPLLATGKCPAKKTT